MGRWLQQLGLLVAMVVLGAVALLVWQSRGQSWDSAPSGYEQFARTRVNFRVYGADSVTAPIGVFQNRCASQVAAVKFRTLSGRAVRVYFGTWNDFDRVRSNAVSPVADLPVTAPMSDAFVDNMLLMVASKGEHQLSHACETLFFAGSAEQPDSLEDVVMDVVYFEPAP